MQVTVIIVNYNVKYFLEHCLLSVMKACKNIAAEILVIDNNSSDGSKEYLSPKFPSVIFFWKNDNLGFGKANNFALQYAKGECILFLNPDTIVPENCFENCINFFKQNKDCGAIGVRMIDGKGRFLKESKRSLPTPTAGFFKIIGLSELFPSSSLFAKYYAGHLPEKENNKVDVLAGAFMMLAKKTVELTKGFDESFFMYGEDIDLSYRIQKLGFENYYLGENTIIHFKGESTQKKSASYVNYFYGAMKHFVSKHYTKKTLLNVLMKLVITIGKYVAITKHFFSIAKANKNNNTLKTLFIGSNKQLENLQSSLEKNNYIVQDVSSSFNKIISIINEQKINAIIACEGIFTNKEIIKALEIFPKSVVILFYEDKADSIIGSNNKNDRGVFLQIGNNTSQ